MGGVGCAVDAIGCSTPRGVVGVCHPVSPVSALGVRAREFAKQYVALVEALQSQGVTEEVVRNEARITALLLLFQDDSESGDRCPLCNKERN